MYFFIVETHLSPPLCCEDFARVSPSLSSFTPFKTTTRQAQRPVSTYKKAFFLCRDTPPRVSPSFTPLKQLRDRRRGLSLHIKKPFSCVETHLRVCLVFFALKTTTRQAQRPVSTYKKAFFLCRDTPPRVSPSFTPLKQLRDRRRGLSLHIKKPFSCVETHLRVCLVFHALKTTTRQAQRPVST